MKYSSLSIKKTLSFILSLFRGLLIELLTPSQKLRSATTLFLVSEADYGYKTQNLHVAHLVDPILSDLISQGNDCLIFTSWNKKYSEQSRVHQTVDYRLLYTFFFFKNFISSSSINLARTISWCDIYLLINPSAIIGIQPGKHACMAANKLKIPIFDLQHSIISESKPYYRFINESKHREKDPTGIICIYKSTYQYLKKLRSPLIIKKIEHPALHGIKRLNIDFNLREFNSYPLLYSQQYGYGIKWGNKNINGRWSSLGISIDFLEALSENLKYKCIFRIHPLETRHEEISVLIGQYLDPSQYIISDKIDPLHHILAGVELHFSYFSTLILDCAELNIKSFVFTTSPDVDQWFYGLESVGLLHKLPNDASAISSALHEHCVNTTK